MFSFDDFTNFYHVCTRNQFGLAKSSKVKPSNPFVILYNLKDRSKVRKKLIRWSLDDLRDLEFSAVVAFLSSKKSNLTDFQMKRRVLSAICNETKKILRARDNENLFHKKFRCFSLDDPTSKDVPDPKASDAFVNVEFYLLLKSCCESVSKPHQLFFDALQSFSHRKIISFSNYNLSKSAFYRKINNIEPVVKSFLYF